MFPMPLIGMYVSIRVVFWRAAMQGGYVYIMTNKPFGIVYIGVTADLVSRATAHREGRGSQFCRRWGLNHLVWMEPFGDIEEAILREKQMKLWKRVWKLRMISESNPNWDDLYPLLNG